MGGGPQFRGAGIVFARRLTRGLPSEAREQFLERLSSEARESLDKTNATHWVPFAHAEEIFTTLAPISHPDAANPYIAFGEAMAFDHLTGMFRVLVQVLSPETLIRQAPRLWGLYHRPGNVQLAVSEPGYAVLEVPDRSDMGSLWCTCVAGWIRGFMRVSGAAEVEVSFEESGPNRTWSARYAL